ncbi:MAG: hypothetical protein MZW92_40465 [Comamonadaceae bacterium]|nr:hypothetical protein [Comamonadaceae bacterium]
MKDEKDDSTLLSRRTFVGSVAAAAGFMIVPRRVLGGPGYQAPSDSVNVATVGYRQRHGHEQHQRPASSCPTSTSSRSATWTTARPRGRAPPDEAPRGGPQRGALQGLPRDAREAEGHRRRGRGHARPRARRDRDGRDAARQARLRAEAADAHGVRGAGAHRGGAQVQGRHADGQPGPLGRGRAPDRGVDRRTAPSARCTRCTAGPTARSGRRACSGRPTRRRCRTASTGTCGSGRRRCGRTTPPTTRPAGAHGGTSAPAPWATWRAT